MDLVCQGIGWDIFCRYDLLDVCVDVPVHDWHVKRAFIITPTHLIQMRCMDYFFEIPYNFLFPDKPITYCEEV